MKPIAISACLLALMAGTSVAQERIELEGTRIFGNRELPQVLTIVPWQQADDVTVTAPEFTSLIDRPLQTIDRKTFQRQVQFHRQLFAPIAAEQNPTTNTANNTDNR